ncbi:hypothetical protein B0H11DRAFT_2192797 [Mycena galericulata]|nr:hypothetical protein B0H11DRAFT_2192797 [Mycena galericulata]
MPTSDCFVVPPYTSSTAMPSYSPEPRFDEVLIAQTPRFISRVFTGTLIKQTGRDTLVLANQDASAEAPTYGRNAFISGFVSLEEREKVSPVVLQLKGKVEVKVFGRDSNSKTVLDDSYTMWSAQDSNDAACPSNLPFGAILPSWTGKLRMPSHRPITLTVPFNYFLRTMPGRPIQPPVSDFLADVKFMPEEWRQTTATRHPHLNSTLGPVDVCTRTRHLLAHPVASVNIYAQPERQLFIPAAEVFAFGDTIPLHVQVVGSVPSLREFLPDPAAASSEPTVNAMLVRRLFLVVNGASTAAEPQPASTASLDWAGVRCKPGVGVGTFDAGDVKAQDFIVVDIIPPTESTAHFPRLRHSHPIRLVTDSWPRDNAREQAHTPTSNGIRECVDGRKLQGCPPSRQRVRPSIHDAETGMGRCKKDRLFDFLDFETGRDGKKTAVNREMTGRRSAARD